jgi:hypothetical protein
MNGGKKSYRKVKSAAKSQARTAKRTAKQTGKTIKRGAKAVASGEKQAGRAMKQQSKGVSTGGTPRKSPRTKMASAQVKMKSGAAAMSKPTPKKKIKKKAYTTTPNIEYGKTPGAKPYLTMKGKPTKRRGGRPKS